ncbi:hypothetical protein B0H14DRAFT_3519404 [Mycena olivaceomarginata]|nr:hypothetical protein B0H14DRAFT_3519404 [Mycena olivaceomarginata]
MAHPLVSMHQQPMTVFPQVLVLARKTASSDVHGMQLIECCLPFIAIVIPEKLDNPRFPTLWILETAENGGRYDFNRLPTALHELTDGCLSARSGSLDEITGALYTLMATNTAMAVTGLILGLKSQPEISFQDGMVIIYLLSMAWITVIFSLASCNRLFGGTEILQLVSVIQSYVIVAFAVVVLGTTPSFGQRPECNPAAGVYGDFMYKRAVV